MCGGRAEEGATVQLGVGRDLAHPLANRGADLGEIVMKSDGEAAIEAVVDVLAALPPRIGAVREKAPRESSGSNGILERAIQSTRGPSCIGCRTSVGAGSRSSTRCSCGWSNMWQCWCSAERELCAQDHTRLCVCVCVQSAIQVAPMQSLAFGRCVQLFACVHMSARRCTFV